MLFSFSLKEKIHLQVNSVAVSSSCFMNLWTELTLSIMLLICISETHKLAFQKHTANCLRHLSLTCCTTRDCTKHQAAVSMCRVWASGLNQIDIDASATKLLLLTSFSHSPAQLCQDYGCCHHSPNPRHFSCHPSVSQLERNECGRAQMGAAEINSLNCFFFH